MRTSHWNTFLLNIILTVVAVVLAAFTGLVLNGERAIREGHLMRGRALFDSIVLTRKWNALHGGVFVEKTPGMLSNPWLKNPDHPGDDGTVYTKKNPALMTREISEIAEREDGFRFHITSLKPVNPANVADSFEREALASFERGATRRRPGRRSTGSPGTVTWRRSAWRSRASAATPNRATGSGTSVAGSASRSARSRRGPRSAGRAGPASGSPS